MQRSIWYSRRSQLSVRVLQAQSPQRAGAVGGWYCRHIQLSVRVLQAQQPRLQVLQRQSAQGAGLHKVAGQRVRAVATQGAGYCRQMQLSARVLQA